MTDAERPMENKEPMFNVTVVSGPKPVPGTKPYVQMTLGVQATPETPGSPMAQVKMRRLEATLGSFGLVDMFAVGRHLWVRWGTEDEEVMFHCRYYKEIHGNVEETGKLIVYTMKEFIDGLRLKNDPKSHVGFLVAGLERSYLPYLLDMGPCPDW